MTLRISFGYALLVILLGACQQTLRLNDRWPDASSSGSGGKSGSGGSGGTGVGPTDASSTDAHCSPSQSVPITFTPDVPQVIVALDRSSTTMEMPFGSQDTEFTAAAADLSTEVSSYQASGGPGRNAKPAIAFSYLDFPNGASDCGTTLGCCASDVTVTPSSQAFQNAVYYACGTPNPCVLSNNRPIAAALATAYNTFAQTNSTQSGQRFVVLVTGGPPSGQCFNPSDCQTAINKVDDLKNKIGVTTYIVGMGDQTNDGCLQAMANDEGFAQFYSPALTPNDLVGALESITGNIADAACRGTLSAPISSSQLMVQFQGTPVMPDFRNGWSLDNGGGSSRLTLHGNACQNYILNYPFGLQISSGCASEHFPSP